MKPILWHCYGILTTLVFMIGLMQLGDTMKGHRSTPDLSSWTWGILAIIGFAGIFPYGRWNQSRR